MWAQANNIKGVDQGKLAQKIYILLDPIFKDFSMIEKFFDRYHSLSKEGNKVFRNATDEAFMFYHVITNNPAVKEFSANQIYKKATKYLKTGKAKSDHNFAKKKMPKDLYNAEFMENVPEFFLLGNRIFELTFVERLNKVFKYK